MLLVVDRDKEQKLQAHVMLYSYIQMKTNYLTKRKAKFKFITKNITIHVHRFKKSETKAQQHRKFVGLPFKIKALNLISFKICKYRYNSHAG